MKMKTILITGATGFLGGNLIKRLSKEDYHLVTLVRNKERWERFVGEACDGYSERLRGVEPVSGDITLPMLGLSGRRFRRLAWQVDAIFHCAALTDFAHGGDLFNTNIEGTRHLLQLALLGSKKHFHHISSAYVAGKSSGTFYEEDFDKGQRFNNSYEESKFNGEGLVRRFTREHSLPFTIYRPSIIVGDSRTGHTQCYKGFYTFARALSLIKEKILKRQGPYTEEADYLRDVVMEIPMRILGDPGALINLVTVDYVVEAISELSKRPEARDKTFHLTNPHPLTLAQLTDKVTQALGIEGVRPWSQDDGPGGASTSGSHHNRTFSPAERFFLSYTRPYLPYLQGRLSFDTSRVRSVLDGTVTCPRITRSLVSLLIDGAVGDRWGMRGEVCSAWSGSARVLA